MVFGSIIYKVIRGIGDTRGWIRGKEQRSHGVDGEAADQFLLILMHFASCNALASIWQNNVDRSTKITLWWVSVHIINMDAGRSQPLVYTQPFWGCRLTFYRVTHSALQAYSILNNLYWNRTLNQDLEIHTLATETITEQRKVLHCKKWIPFLLLT